MNAITGISGNTLVGTYIESSRFHPTIGFVYRIPEPSTFVLALCGVTLLLFASRRLKSRQ